MITPEQALTLLQDTIKHKRRHADYTRVTELASLYHKLISGEGADSLLQRFIRRESDTEFSQRVNLTQHITPSIAEAIMTPFYRLGRLDNIKRGLLYDGDNGTRAEALEDVLKGFWGNEHLERYLSTRLVDLNFTDPNAFVLVDFEEFDYRREKAQPYPYEISSTEAINYSYKNNKLEWLICHTIKDEENPETGRKRKQERYYLYTDDFVISAIQNVDTSEATAYYYDALEQGIKPLKDFEVWGGNDYTTWENTGKRYDFQLFRHKAGMVQAVRVGYKLDQVTNGRTYVSPMQPAVPYFMELVKSVSELQLSVSLHVFPKLSIYEEACPGLTIDNTYHACNKGSDTLTGQQCKKCGGSGILVHRSSQDIKVYPKPKHKEDVIPLADLEHYHTIPIHIVQWLGEYVDKLKLNAYRAVYNSDIIGKPQFGETATKVIEAKEEMTNALFPFAEKYSSIYRYLVSLAASFTDMLQGLEIIFEFPSDYKLKTEAEMLLDLQNAKNSGASAFLIQQIELDIARKRFADDEQGFKKYVTKTQFTPFLGKSEAYITALFMSNDVRPEDKVLYNYVDTIFDELEVEQPGFFDLAPNQQTPIVMAKVKTILEQLPQSVAPSLTLGE